MHSNYCNLLTPSELRTPDCPLGITGLTEHRRITQSWNDFCCSRSFICTIIQVPVLSGGSSEWVAVLRGGKEGKRGMRQRWEEIGRKMSCVCSDSAAQQRLHRIKLRSPCPHFIVSVHQRLSPPPLCSFCSFPLLPLTQQSPPLFAPSACWYVGGRPDQSLNAVGQLDVSQACVGKTGSSGSLRSHAWMWEVLPLMVGGWGVSLVSLVVFTAIFTSLFRSELLDVRMLSPGKIRWCLWAPLVLLALVSGVPSKAQDQGKCCPPPAFLSLVSDNHPTPPCPQAIGSEPPLIFTPHHSPLHFSPLLISLPLLSPTSTSSGCLMWGLAPPSPDYAIESPPFHPSLLPVYTHARAGGV